MTKDNNLLGKFELMGIPPAPRGIPRVQVTFNVDANGILSVNAREESTGKSKNIKIKNEKGRLNKSEIDKMISDAEKYREEDEKCKLRVSSRNSLESYLFSVRSAIKEYGSKFSEIDLRNVEKLVNENIAWLEVNRDRDSQLYEEKYNELQRLIMPIMSKLHKKGGLGVDQDGPKIEEVN